MFAEGGDEHNRRQRPTKAAYDFEAIEHRHLDVEQDEVGVELGDQLERVLAVPGFSDDQNVRDLAQLFAQHPSRQRFVVDNERA